MTGENNEQREKGRLSSEHKFLATRKLLRRELRGHGANADIKKSVSIRNTLTVQTED